MRSRFVCYTCKKTQTKGANSRYCDFCGGGLRRKGDTFQVKTKYSNKPIKKIEGKEEMITENKEVAKAHVDELTRYGSHVLFIWSDENGWFIKDEETAKEAVKHYKEISGIELPHQFIMDIAKSMRTTLKELVAEMKKDLIDCYKQASHDNGAN